MSEQMEVCIKCKNICYKISVRNKVGAVLTVFTMGMVRGSSQVCRCPIPISCKLSDPLKVIPDGIYEGGIQSTPVSHSQ